MMERKPLILIGGGGHCKSVIEAAESCGRRILGILDKPDNVGSDILRYKVIGTDDDIPSYVNRAEFVVTVGSIKSPDIRIKLHQKVEQAGGQFATVIASTARVSRYARIGAGSVILHFAHINADASIGKGCIINTAANIEHDVVVGVYSHISTGAMINGMVEIGEGAFIGSGSVVANCVTIASGVVVGAGAVVCKNLDQKGIYVGNPAILKTAL